jgi:hypothetical protein
MLKNRLGGKRIRFADAERALLARKAKAVGRHLLDAEDGVLAGKRSLIVDRDTKYSKRFRDFIAEGGT